MTMNAKKWLIILGLVATLILASIWGLQSGDQAPEEVLETKKSQELYHTQEQEPVLFAWITFEKQNETPEDYVVLTEDDLEQFPAIQAALQEFAESNQTKLGYKTSEQEATEFQEYIFDKYRERESCKNPLSPSCFVYHFKYQETYYSVGVAMPEDRVSTAAVPEVPLTSGVLLLTSVILALHLQGKKERKRN
ncbi:MAG: hypothetical protein ACE5R6_01405 [Candidatus Heimdallarchaeota archaeon]